MLKNPFVTNGYAGAEYFCDREEETQNILSLLENENNVALISPRRIGKTDLLRHCFNCKEMTDNYYTFIIDIYATTSTRDFVNVFGKAIIEELRPKGRKVWEKFINILSSLRSEISFDINGMPVWGMNIGSISNPDITLDEIFKYLNAAECPCIVAIDEFQQITNYDNNHIEAALRTYIQRCTNAHFVFSGSHRHLMGEMFTSPSRPFYQSVTIINLAPIPKDKYCQFALKMFEDYGKQLDREVPHILYEKFNAVTSYLQRVMNVLFLRTPEGGICKTEMIGDAINYILDMSSDTYDFLLYLMPEKQRDVFTAIAKEGEAKNVLSGSFVKRHALTSPSSVKSAIAGLLDKDFITYNRGTYKVYDKFFELWLLRMI
jgi:AAA+ ATPase superfamily predicted ATPase